MTIFKSTHGLLQPDYITDSTNSNIKVKYHPHLKQWYMTNDDVNWIGLSRSIKYGQTALSYARDYFNPS